MSVKQKSLSTRAVYIKIKAKVFIEKIIADENILKNIQDKL
jgi:hypothetical protein